MQLHDKTPHPLAKFKHIAYNAKLQGQEVIFARRPMGGGEESEDHLGQEVIFARRPVGGGEESEDHLRQEVIFTRRYGITAGW